MALSTFFKARGNEEPKIVAGTKRYWSPEILRKLLKQKRSDFPHPNKESSEHTKLKTSMTFGNEASEAWALGYVNGSNRAVALVQSEFS